MLAEPLPVALSGEERRRRDLVEAKLTRARRVALMYGEELSSRERADMMGADLYMCKHSDVYFINSWGWVQAPKLGEMYPELLEIPFVLWPAQEEVSEWLDERVAAEEDAIVRKGREIGVTWLMLWKRLAAWMFRGSSSKLFSRKQDLVDRRYDSESLFEKLRFGIRKLPPHLWPNQKRRVAGLDPVLDNREMLKNWHNAAEITGESTNLGSGRGGRRGVLVLDEFGQVEPLLAANVVRSTESVARSRWFSFNYNPLYGKSHPSMVLFEEKGPEQKRWLRWQTDPYRDEDFLASKTFPVGSLSADEAAVEYDADDRNIGGLAIWRFDKQRIGYTDTPDNARELKAGRAAWDCAGGMDFGSGWSLCVMVNALIDWTEDPRNFRILVDSEGVWQQTAWQSVAADGRELLQRYGGYKLLWGDPGGQAPESDQQNWITNLRAGGIPIWALPYVVNREDVELWARRYVQLLMDSGRLLIHLDNCPWLVTSMTEWRLDVPKGITDLKYLNKRFVRPRHDEFSHACKAFLYMVAGVVRAARERIAAGKSAAKRARMPDVEDLGGEGSVDAWRSLYRGEIFGDED